MAGKGKPKGSMSAPAPRKPGFPGAAQPFAKGGGRHPKPKR